MKFHLLTLACLIGSIESFTTPKVLLHHNVRESSTYLKSSTAVDVNDGITIGDTRGAALLIEDVAVSRGANRILTNINFRVERGQRWGIVGPNGAGKSTLLGALTGSARMDEGRALVAPKTDVG